MIGHIYIEDEGGGGAYFLDGGKLCHAPFEFGRYRWHDATQIDPYDINEPDPGWDYARMARHLLTDRQSPELCCPDAHEFADGHAFCRCGADRWDSSLDA